jgi:hypothetical protein
LTLTLVELVVTLKSGPVTTTCVERVIVALVAVKVTLNIPSAEETVSVKVADAAVGDSIALVELSIVVAWPGGTVVARLTVPENPLDPATVIVDVPEDPEFIVKNAGLADTMKLGAGTVTATLVEWEKIDELLAVTLTPYEPGDVPSGT